MNLSDKELVGTQTIVNSRGLYCHGCFFAAP